MPEITIPLFGQPTQRGPISTGAFTAGQDQRIINAIFTVIDDGMAGKKAVYIEKRPGLETFSTPAAGSAGFAIFVSPSTSKVITAFGNPSTIYANTTNCGSLDTATFSINECIINGITFQMMVSTSSTGWFLASDSFAATTFTGDTHTNTTIDNVSSLTGLYVGQLLSGHADIAAGTRIATITAPSTITTTLATVGTHSGITITRSAVAKIINANFPTSVVGNLVEMDGFIFAFDSSNVRIYNSDLNSITNWTAGNFIPVNIQTDGALNLVKRKNYILAFGTTSIEVFQNTGNASNSPLSSVKQAVSLTGGGQVLCSVFDYIFFTGPTIATSGIWTLEELSPKKISTPPIDRIVGNSGFSWSVLSSFYWGGYTWLLIVNGESPYRFFFYCVELKQWIEQVFPNNGIIGCSSKSTTLGTSPYFVDGGTSGKVFVWDQSPVYTDNASAFTMTIQLEPKVLNKGKGFVINSVELLADNQSSGSTTLSISRDDYASFQVLGSFDLNQRRKRIMRGGLCRNHAIFTLEDSGNNAWRGQALVVNYSPCAT